MGLQDKDIGATKEELGIEREQVLSNFIKTMKKLYGYLHNIAGKEIEATLPRLKEVSNHILFPFVNLVLTRNSCTSRFGIVHWWAWKQCSWCS
jgi:hypothetical protein